MTPASRYTHRHRFLPERPSQVIEGATVERCTKDRCGTVRIRPPDAAVTVGRPAESAATRVVRPAVTGAAGEVDRRPGSSSQRKEA